MSLHNTELHQLRSWRYKERSDKRPHIWEYCEILDQHDSFICKIESTQFPTTKAAVRLIAAAPEMFELLKSFSSNMENSPGEKRSLEEVMERVKIHIQDIEKAKELIQKIEGDKK